jgi:hypothetical protein
MPSLRNLRKEVERLNKLRKNEYRFFSIRVLADHETDSETPTAENLKPQRKDYKMRSARELDSPKN